MRGRRRRRRVASREPRRRVGRPRVRRVSVGGRRPVGQRGVRRRDRVASRVARGDGGGVLGAPRRDERTRVASVSRGVRGDVRARDDASVGCASRARGRSGDGTRGARRGGGLASSPPPNSRASRVRFGVDPDASSRNATRLAEHLAGFIRRLAESSGPLARARAPFEAIRAAVAAAMGTRETLRAAARAAPDAGARRGNPRIRTEGMGVCVRRSRGHARGVERGDGRGEKRRDARRPGGSSRGGGAGALLRRRRRARRRGGGIEVAGIPRVHGVRGVHGVGDWKITRHVVVSRETRRRRVESIRGGRMGAGRSRPRPSNHPGDVLVAPTTSETRGGRGRLPRGSHRVGPRPVDLRVGETLGGRDRRVCRGRVTRRARGGEGRRAKDAREPRGGGGAAAVLGAERVQRLAAAFPEEAPGNLGRGSLEKLPSKMDEAKATAISAAISAATAATSSKSIQIPVSTTRGSAFASELASEQRPEQRRSIRDRLAYARSSVAPSFASSGGFRSDPLDAWNGNRGGFAEYPPDDDEPDVGDARGGDDDEVVEMFEKPAMKPIGAAWAGARRRAGWHGDASRAPLPWGQRASSERSPYERQAELARARETRRVRTDADILANVRRAGRTR